MSKGYLIFAQNNETVDYVRQAYALALSIKFTQPNINSVSGLLQLKGVGDATLEKLFKYINNYRINHLNLLFWIQ